MPIKNPNSFRSFCAMLVITYTKIKLNFVCSFMLHLFWCILNHLVHKKVYRRILKCSNLPIMQIRPGKKDGERGNTFSFRVCLVGIRDASYIFESLLVKGNILAYFLFFENKNSPIKKVCPFNISWIIDTLWHYINK